MAYHVRLDIYEGPLALLVHLIESQELDIWNIPIAQISEQYLQHLSTMEEMQLEVGGEFLVMAATLLAIKARMLLPDEEPDDVEDIEDEEIDPRDELVRRILEYRQFRTAADWLEERLDVRGVVAGRGTPPAPGTVAFLRPVGDATAHDLAKAYARVLEASTAAPAPLPSYRHVVSVEERVIQIMEAVRRSGLVPFGDLCTRQERRFVIVTFLAVLEMVRQGKAVATQDGLFGPIIIENEEASPAQ